MVLFLISDVSKRQAIDILRQVQDKAASFIGGCAHCMITRLDVDVFDGVPGFAVENIPFDQHGFARRTDRGNEEQAEKHRRRPFQAQPSGEQGADISG